MPIPTELVGSLPRPSCTFSVTYQQLAKRASLSDIDLHQAFNEYDSGKISKEELIKIQDKATEESLEGLKATLETYITDGDQRASS